MPTQSFDEKKQINLIIINRECPTKNSPDESVPNLNGYLDMHMDYLLSWDQGFLYGITQALTGGIWQGSGEAAVNYDDQIESHRFNRIMHKDVNDFRVFFNKPTQDRMILNNQFSSLIK